MKRSDFIKALLAAPLASKAMKLNELDKLTQNLQGTEKMPLLFLGHGSPMNAIEENEFVRGFRSMGKDIPNPKAVLVISAHWETKGTFVTAMEKPRTIHDFGGFPQALFEVQYPAPGNPDLARQTRELVKKTEIGLDQNWGLDHGAWSVVKHLYPKADVPVLQLSLDYTKDGQYHYDLAKELVSLREKGILIVGSGNMVHNLGKVAWDKLNTDNFGYDWALESGDKMKKYIMAGENARLINFRGQGKSWDLAIPTPEHFLPLLYILALKDENEKISFHNDKAVAGALTMTSVKVEKN